MNRNKLLKLKNQKIIDDLDHDGLKDWEESVYKTNPADPDTDNDGYLDGEEIAAGYDPTKPAPNDKTAISEPAKSTRPEPGNLTQILAYLLSNQLKFDQFPLLSANSQNIASLEEMLEGSVDQKITEAIQRSSTTLLSQFIPDYQEELIKTTPDNSLTAIRKYAGQASQKIGRIDSCQNINNLKNDSQIIQESIETKNYQQVNCLANSYHQAYQELLATPVPSDWLYIHQKLLNIFWSFHKIYQLIPSYEKDPLKGLIVLEKFEETTKKLSQLFQEMKTDLDNRQFQLDN